MTRLPSIQKDGLARWPPPLILQFGNGFRVSTHTQYTTREVIATQTGVVWMVDSLEPG